MPSEVLIASRCCTLLFLLVTSRRGLNMMDLSDIVCSVTITVVPTTVEMALVLCTCQLDTILCVN